MHYRRGVDLSARGWGGSLLLLRCVAGERGWRTGRCCFVCLCILVFLVAARASPLLLIWWFMWDVVGERNAIIDSFALGVAGQLLGCGCQLHHMSCLLYSTLILYLMPLRMARLEGWFDGKEKANKRKGVAGIVAPPRSRCLALLDKQYRKN